jgi:hypothetical protein
VVSIQPYERTLRPDRMCLWPVEDERYGVDVTWAGAEGFTRADRLKKTLAMNKIPHRLLQEADGRRWTVRVGPVTGEEVLRLLDSFLR